MERIKQLDKILLNDTVVKEFYQAYQNQEFKNWLLSILPEVEDCNKQQQDNPWHIYNCLDHILHSVEEINKQTKDLDDTTRRMLAYVMFYHDIGKPACYSRRYGKMYGREVDSFFHHNEKSAEIAKRTLSSFGFTKEQVKAMVMLVEKHDIFMFIRLEASKNAFHKVLSEELVCDEVHDLDQVGDGLTLMNYLVKVGRADSKSQNPAMTASSLELLDATEKIVDNMMKKRKGDTSDDCDIRP